MSPGLQLSRRARQPIRYLLVAGTTTTFYLALLATGLAVGLHYLVAILIAQALTIAVAFPAYRHWVFGPGASVGKDFFRFLSVWSSGAVAGLVVTPFLVEVLGWHPMWAQIFAIAVVSIASFLAHRFITFRPPADEPATGPNEQGYWGP
jgi:putative flippase GtrA